MTLNIPHLQAFDENDINIGFFDGEFVMSHSNEFLYRVDDEDIYTPGTNTQLLGFFRNGIGTDLSNNVIFTVRS